MPSEARAERAVWVQPHIHRLGYTAHITPLVMTLLQRRSAGEYTVPSWVYWTPRPRLEVPNLNASTSGSHCPGVAPVAATDGLEAAQFAVSIIGNWSAGERWTGRPASQ